MLNLNAVDEGFSRKAEVYDEYCERHPVIRWARRIIRDEVIGNLPPHASILELNAGTGSDAAYFAKQGYRVHATDIATGMISAIQAKIKMLDVGGRFTVQKISFTELEQTIGVPYDLIFSNFGGLNCIPDLQAVTQSLPRLLKPGGHVVWVIMPPICPWDMVHALRGKFNIALRRFNAHGTLANVENAKIMTWYHSPKKVTASFGADFQLARRRSVSLFCPPSYMDRFPHRFAVLTNILMKLDETLGRRYPFSCWGDFVVYTYRYAPV